MKVVQKLGKLCVGDDAFFVFSKVLNLIQLLFFLGDAFLGDYQLDETPIEIKGDPFKGLRVFDDLFEFIESDQPCALGVKQLEGDLEKVK